VATGEFPGRGQDRAELVEVVDHQRKRLDQFRALVAHVAFEKRRHPGRDLEQGSVKMPGTLSRIGATCAKLDCTSAMSCGGMMSCPYPVSPLADPSK